ncbi:MAG TPA: hypothetical protein DIV41_05420, partial [Ruminococcaceae bacterium]|nr:hypothetical protein [Oscillospiraceae bacterium]
EYSTGEKLIFYQESERLLQSMQESGEYKGPLQKGIAELLGISTRQVRKYQAVMNLPTDMQHAVIDGKISINDACKSDSKSGTGSAFRENNKRRDEVVPEIDHTYWDRRIHTAIKRAYNILELYDYYVSCVPTPQEAIKEKLKPQYYRGGNVDFSDNLYGFYDVKPNKFLISSGKMQISLTYSQVDKYVREMIRQGTLISKEDISRIWAEKLK